MCTRGSSRTTSTGAERLDADARAYSVCTDTPIVLLTAELRSLMTGAFSGAAYRNRTDDLFITRELHTPKALNWPASTASTKATQISQHDQIEVMYAQKYTHARSRSRS
jgi:hypothetical protein